MGTPQHETKIEALTEAIETLAIAVSKSVVSHGGSEAFAEVTDARKTVRDALAEFLKPSLRLVQ